MSKASYANKRVAKELWKILGDVAIDEDECIDEKFLHFPEGTFREDIWHWIENELDVPVYELMFGNKQELD